MNVKPLETIDPEMATVLDQELERQSNTLELIASENIASRAVMSVQGSVLTNKYAEGYPQKRYYGGCEFVDVAESLAIERARQLFQAEYANVQPHSGSQANMAVFFALLQPGDTVLGMNLSHGGHLTHGSPVNFSGRLFNFVHYGVREDTGIIDYDAVSDLAQQHRPKMIVAGASAYPRVIDFEAFARIANSIDAMLMVDMAHIAGLVAAGLHPSPLPHAQAVTSTTHKTLRGPRGGLIMAKEEWGPRLGKEIFPGIQGGPLMHVIAAKAVAFKEAMGADFKHYQVDTVKNAKALAEGLMAAGIKLVSDGTDNHMMLLDLTTLDISGKDAQIILEAAGVTTNKNAIPGDKRGPLVTSGIRIGTPALTSRGMQVQEMAQVATLIADILKNPQDTSVAADARNKVLDLCRAFPIYAQ